MDKKEIVFSTIAGLAVVFIGYLVWRHEETISIANSQAEQQAQSDAANQQAEQLMNEIASLPVSGGGSYTPQYGNGASTTSDGTDDTGSTSLQSPASASGDLQSILNAFFPPTTTPPVSTTSAPVNTTTATGPKGNSGWAPTSTTPISAQPVTPTLPTTNTGGGQYCAGGSGGGGGCGSIPTSIPIPAPVSNPIPVTISNVGSSLFAGSGVASPKLNTNVAAPKQMVSA